MIVFITQLAFSIGTEFIPRNEIFQLISNIATMKTSRDASSYIWHHICEFLQAVPDKTLIEFLAEASAWIYENILNEPPILRDSLSDFLGVVIGFLKCTSSAL